MSPIPRIGYVVKMFPRLSETFILNEILELERRGVPVNVFSLSEPSQDVTHQVLREIRALVIYLSKSSFLKRWAFLQGRFAENRFEEQSLLQLCEDEALSDEGLAILRGAVLAVLARRHRIDHLHAHFGNTPTTVAMLASRLTGIPFSFTAHAKDLYQEGVDRELLKEKIRLARFVITVSEYNHRFLLDLADNGHRSHIIRMYNGVDLEKFQRTPHRTRQPGLIVTVGRLVEKKGFLHLIRACRRLQEQGISFRCLIIGDGPERETLGQEIHALGLEAHVALLGAQSQEELLAILREAAVFVLPCVISRDGDRDGLPTVLLEAMAVGLPCVSTTVSGIPEIVEHGKTGLLVPPGDPLHLAGALEVILTHPGLQEEFGLAGRRKAEQAFDVQHNVQVLHELFLRSETNGSPLSLGPSLR